MPRFVILEHDWPQRHWDFMLESGSVLRTWRLTAPPEPGQTVAAEVSFDHRLAYLDYEGPVSGGRGSVLPWDGGTFTWQVDEPERVVVRLCGGRLQGEAELRRSACKQWSLRMCSA
jgi:hypothetical protein